MISAYLVSSPYKHSF